MVNLVCVAILFKTCLKIYIICHTKGGKGSYVLYFSYYLIYVASLKIMGIFVFHHGLIVAFILNIDVIIAIWSAASSTIKVTTSYYMVAFCISSNFLIS